MTIKYFNVKHGITTGNITLDATTGNITGINNANLGNAVSANYFVGNGYLLTNINGSNVSGTVANASHATTANTVVDAAQPNITSLGTLSSLSVTGNIVSGNVYANSGTIGASLVTGTLTTAAQPNITSLGSLESLFVGNATSNVSITNGTVTSTANITAPYFIGNVVGNISGNIVVPGTNTSVLFNNDGNAGASSNFTFNKDTNVATVNGNLVAGNVYANTGTIGANLLTGTLTTAAQPNITSLGDLTSLGVTGNATVANLIANATVFAANVNASSNIHAAHFIGPAFTSNFANVTISAAAGDNSVTLVPTGTGTVDVSSKRITSLADPTQSTDAATKAYVDAVAEGLHVHASVKASTTNTLAILSGGTVDYDNGTAGVGATLTITGGSLTTLDGYTLQNGDRILVKDETNQAHNGIYVWATGGTVLTRATDYDTAAEIQTGDFVFVSNGSLYNDTGWVQLNDVTTVGTDSITWSQFSGAGTYTAGAGLTLTGTSFSVNTDNVTTDIVSGNVVVKAGAQLTTPNIGAATGTSLTVTGNVSGNLLTGTLTSSAQPNITSLGTLSNLTVNGLTNLGPNSNVTITGGSTGQVLSTDGTGSLSWISISTSSVSNGTSNVNIPVADGNINLSVGSTANVLVVTATGANVTGTLGVSGDTSIVGNVVVATSEAPKNLNVYGTVQIGGVTVIDGTRNVSANGITASGNIAFTGPNVSLGAVSNLHITGGTSGYLLSTDGSGALSWIAPPSTTGITNGTSNVSIPDVNGNVNTSVGGTANVLVVTTTGANINGTVTATGNLTVSNANLGNLATANFFSGNGSALFDINGSNVVGAVSSATTAGTVTSNAQPNITSVGNLTSLVVSGNATVGYALVNSGVVSNRANVEVSSATVIDQFPTSTFRTAKYVISASSVNGYQSAEVLLVHDGSSSYITIYGSISSNATVDIVEFSTNANGTSGNIELIATAVSGTANVNLISSYIKA
jgi:hypothetical protein